MYGIMTQDGHRVLCRGSWKNYGPLVPTYVLKRWDRNGIPVMKESPMEIDELMQQYMTSSGDYSLIVFKFTEEQVLQETMKRLRGY